MYVGVCCIMLQCVAACCIMLQCVAACCSVLQRVAACCRHKIKLSHMYEWVTSRMNKSCEIYGWVMSNIKLTYKQNKTTQNQKRQSRTIQWALHIATHCNALQRTLQHTATHRNTLQHTATSELNTLLYTATLQHTATQCNTLQHTATHCNALQYTAMHNNTLLQNKNHYRVDAQTRISHCATHSSLLCVAAYFS